MYSNKSPFNLFLIPVGSPESIWKFSGLGTFEYISALKLLVLKKTKHFKTAKLLKDERAQHFFLKYFFNVHSIRKPKHFFLHKWLLEQVP